MGTNIVLRKLKKGFLLLGFLGALSYFVSHVNFFDFAQAAPQSPQQQPSQRAVANETMRVSYAAAVTRAAPAVVSIQTTKKIPLEIHPLWQDPWLRYFFGFGDPGQKPGGPRGGNNIPEQHEQLQHGLGSGVIVNKKGYIITNNHVIKDASTIVVKLPDGRDAEAKVVGSDPQTDIAVLKIKLKNLPVANLGDSGSLEVGDVVLAIGNPFGFGRTVTQGIVSAMGSIQSRHADNVTFGALLDNLIQTDAAINPGNSGGALIDAHGNLIGINMAIITRSGGNQGIGFAIPIDLAKTVMGELIDSGHIARGWLGTQLSELSDEIREYLDYKDKTGVYVQATFRNSPAQRAGILPGDIISKINNAPVTDLYKAVRFVTNLKPGKPYPIEVFRKGDYITFSVVLGERPADSDKK